MAAYTVAILALLGWQAILAAAAAAVFAFWCGGYVTRLLGGLTGDVYGTLCTVSELIVLLVYLCTFSVFFEAMARFFLHILPALQDFCHLWRIVYAKENISDFE